MEPFKPYSNADENVLIEAIQRLDLTTEHIKKMEGYGMKLELPFEEKLKKNFDSFLNYAKPEIPKHIHQVWIGENEPPWAWINGFREKLTQHFPEWTHTLWREKDIADLALQNQKAYNQETQLSGKVNILRYELLYQFGGIYIDADMEWLNKKSLDDLLEEALDTGFFAGKEDDEMLANSVIGSSAKNPILLLLIKTINQTFTLTRKTWQLPTWQSTGPRMFSEVCKYFPITRFPVHYFYPVSWLKNNLGIDTQVFKDSYMIQYGYTTNGLQKSISP